MNGSARVRATGAARRFGAVLAGAGLTALLVAGCSSSEQAPSDFAGMPGEPPVSSGDAAAPLPVVEEPTDADEQFDDGSEGGNFQGQQHGGQPLIVRDSGTKLTEDCQSRKVIVLGSDVDLTLNGTCTLVKVQGANSTVQVGSAQKIIAVGTGDTVRYATGQPQVINPRGNDVSQGGSATP
ncbi:DUF3060 domain-containing protein [Saccharopolyspora sp. WRP15-2]|uniref:DUF3060 domain-containing protein n=1 Tax=Saccharopolyspora oryzae TaxID=2997343 RepID=A0ABT4V334_9PSEU|nr:DUF3060 domain-containing protein [Saccharopolyspora oryzae]MDA3628379.1 DUF3060 domain-containing protein [Saccharopolyspora oryzae]